MSKILAIDYGRVRMGLAISDSSRTIAFPLKIVPVKNKKQVMEEIRNLISQEQVELVIVGLPLNMNGTEGEQCAEIRTFADKLSKQLGVQVEYFDERLTTMVAEKSMLEGDLSRRKRKLKRDKIAAAILLQNYLDKNI